MLVVHTPVKKSSAVSVHACTGSASEKRMYGLACSMPSSGWKASPAKGDRSPALLYVWWSACSHRYAVRDSCRPRWIQ